MDITKMEMQLQELMGYLPMLRELKEQYDEHRASKAEHEARMRDEDQAVVARDDDDRKAVEKQQHDTDCAELREELAELGITDRTENGPFGPLTGKENLQELTDTLDQARRHGIKKPEPEKLESDDEYRIRVLNAANDRDKDQVSKASGKALDNWGDKCNLTRLGKSTDSDG